MGCAACTWPPQLCNPPTLSAAFNKQINFSSCVQALPGTASGFSISFSTPEKQMESSRSQMKLLCCPRYVQSRREEGNFGPLPPGVSDVEFSLEAT